MTPEPDPDLFLLYVAGLTDEDECVECDKALSNASPEAQAMYAEAWAVFHSLPLCLDCIEPPASVRHTLLGRVTADISSVGPDADGRDAEFADAFPRSIPIHAASAAASPSYATRMRWPLYVSSGLAACLAVGLSLSLWNNRQLSEYNERIAATNAKMNETLTEARNVLGSPHVTLASLQTSDKVSVPRAKSYGQALFCPVSRRYQFAVFNLSPLPPEKTYEVWLVSADGRKVPGGTFKVNPDGSAFVTAHCSNGVDAVSCQITDEPANGSQQPTGAVHLAGRLPPKASPITPVFR